MNVIFYFSGATTFLDEHALLSLLVDIDSKWYEIGLSLKLKYNFLHGLNGERFSNTVKLSYVINKWITSADSQDITWETIISAIEGPFVDDKQISRKIHKYLTDQLKNGGPTMS